MSTTLVVRRERQAPHTASKIRNQGDTVPPQSAPQRINPSDETIQAGPVTIRFLLTGEDSGGSVAAFEFMVPAGK